MRVSPVGITSVVISCLAGGTRVSFHSGWFIDEGVGREGPSSMTNVCLDGVSSKYSSFGSGTANGHCWSFAHL